jgi:hypothetical protein
LPPLVPVNIRACPPWPVAARSSPSRAPSAPSLAAGGALTHPGVLLSHRGILLSHPDGSFTHPASSSPLSFLLCCNCMFQLFETFQRYVAVESSGCCKSRSGDVAIVFRGMLQAYVSSVSDVFRGMLQAYVSGVTDVFRGMFYLCFPDACWCVYLDVAYVSHIRCMCFI